MREELVAPGVVAVYCLSDAERLTSMFRHPCTFAQQAPVINWRVQERRRTPTIINLMYSYPRGNGKKHPPGDADRSPYPADGEQMNLRYRGVDRLSTPRTTIQTFAKLPPFLRRQKSRGVNSSRQLWVPAISPTTRLNRSRYSRFKLVMVAIRSTISIVSTLTVHTLCSNSITLSLWSAKR